ncbi:hypothetical protein [Sphingomonas sp. TREG-RG-20F-R18-01]|uniref:hypothetical protein n=1 Tax=Sphingomonas sp. TREG-RG-20F-R18-01 TaxID=2914982 RepID=UPI001F56635F|nr:hypothetical protein [Sphingomonas sp. TREG-RG-20F-R18-01]
MMNIAPDDNCFAEPITKGEVSILAVKITSLMNIVVAALGHSHHGNGDGLSLELQNYTEAAQELLNEVDRMVRPNDHKPG